MWLSNRIEGGRREGGQGASPLPGQPWRGLWASGCRRGWWSVKGGCMGDIEVGPSIRVCLLPTWRHVPPVSIYLRLCRFTRTLSRGVLLVDECARTVYSLLRIPTEGIGVEGGLLLLYLRHHMRRWLVVFMLLGQWALIIDKNLHWHFNSEIQETWPLYFLRLSFPKD